MESIFAAKKANVYPYCWEATLHVDRLIGGIPSDRRAVEAWVRKNTGFDNESEIQKMVAETMVERGLNAEEAIAEVVSQVGLQGFKRDPEHGLYIEGRQIKSAIKEAANVAWPKRRWGPSNKGTRSFIAEHVFVVEDRLLLGVTEPSGIQDRFVHTYPRASLASDEYVSDAKVSFTVIADVKITPEDWEEIWVRSENLGIGAVRSQGFGRHAVVRWEQIRGE